MIYNVYKPIPALAEIVDHYWYSKMELTNAVIQQYPTPFHLANK